MLPLAADWSTISSLATGAGTLVLAVATFASVRSANRSARVAEEALLEQRRPVLAPSRYDDPPQKIMFVERNWVRADGGRGVAQFANGRIYLAMSLRNVGAGIGVCQAWAATASTPSASRDHLPESHFRAQTRDLYIPAGDLGMWQGAMRDPDEPGHADIAEAIQAGEPLIIELLYSDQVGEQRTISRFGLVPFTDPKTDEVTWNVSVVRHWFLDRPGPRSESDIQARAEQILNRLEADRDAPAPVEVGAVEVDETASDDERPEDRGAAESDQVPEATQANGGEPVPTISRPSCE
jgi:hypothetical protein